MLVAYASDERYVALPDVLLELESLDIPGLSFEARSRATGSVHIDRCGRIRRTWTPRRRDKNFRGGFSVDSERPTGSIRNVGWLSATRTLHFLCTCRSVRLEPVPLGRVYADIAAPAGGGSSHRAARGGRDVSRPANIAECVRFSY